MSDFHIRLKSNAEAVENRLTQLLADQPLQNEVLRPVSLMQAMRHSALDGGKRLRPFLLIETAALFGVDGRSAVDAGTALELIHCYSLVHDDLPAMDDDKLRRGKPTTHIAFGEANAILAGDALLTLAFDVLSREETHGDAAVRVELVRLLARYAGLGGMVGGQVLDLEAEEKTEIGEQEILTLQAMKTGALIRCACEMGAVLDNAADDDRQRISRFGRLVGQAFQLADDILDVTSDTQTMGKQTGKDANRGKGTLVELYGLDTARSRASELLEETIATLEPYGRRASALVEAARFTVERQN